MDRRSDQQRKAIEVFCRELADELNAKGHTVKLVLEAMRKGADIPWTQAAVKELLWKVMQKALVDKKSTTELDTKEPSDIHQSLMHWITENLEGVDYIDFPSQR